jgi:hypothetical protein
MKAIKIDSHLQTITEIEVNGLTDMQKAVEGLIEVAAEIKHGSKYNTVYVNEEGLFEPHTDWFIWDGAHQPFKGNGLVVGYNPKSGNSLDSNMTVADVQKFVRFVSEDVVRLDME